MPPESKKKEVHGIVKLRRRIETAIRANPNVEKLVKTAILYEVKLDDIELTNLNELPKQGNK